MIYILLFEYPWAGTSQWLLVLCMCMQIINKEHITQLYADGDDQDEDGEGEDGDVVDNWEYDITVVRSGAGENLLLSVSKGEARFPISGTKDGQWKCLRCSSAQGLTCVHAAQFKGWVSELDPDQLPEVLLANINLQEMQDEDADGGNIFTQWNSISSSGRPGPFINYERLMECSRSGNGGEHGVSKPGTCCRAEQPGLLQIEAVSDEYVIFLHS